MHVSQETHILCLSIKDTELGTCIERPNKKICKCTNKFSKEHKERPFHGEKELDILSGRATKFFRSTYLA